MFSTAQGCLALRSGLCPSVHLQTCHPSVTVPQQSLHSHRGDPCSPQQSSSQCPLPTPPHPHPGAPAGGQRQFPLLSSLLSSLPTRVHSVSVNICSVLSSEPTEQPVWSTWEFPTPTKPREHQHGVWRMLGQLMLLGGRGRSRCGWDFGRAVKSPQQEPVAEEQIYQHQ